MIVWSVLYFRSYFYWTDPLVYAFFGKVLLLALILIVTLIVQSDNLFVYSSLKNPV